MERAASLDVRCFVVKSCIVIGIDVWIWVKKGIPKTCAVHFMVAHQHSSAIQVTRSPQLWRLHLQKSPPCDASNTLALKFGTIRRLKAMGLHLRECATSINCDLHCINSWLVASQDDIIHQPRPIQSIPLRILVAERHELTAEFDLGIQTLQLADLLPHTCSEARVDFPRHECQGELQKRNNITLRLIESWLSHAFPTDINRVRHVPLRTPSVCIIGCRQKGQKYAGVGQVPGDYGIYENHEVLKALDL